MHDVSLIELIVRANHLLVERFQDQLKAHGVSGTEWRVLAALAARDGATMTELAELVLFKQPTLTKAVDRMERSQLVQRRTPEKDRRRTLVHLTERGRRIAAPLMTEAHQHELAVARALGEPRRRELCAALSALIERVEALPRGLQAAAGDAACAD